MAKQPYYPNNWSKYKNMPDEFFESIDYEEFMEWKLDGWELPSSIFMIIREENYVTGLVEEHIYRNPVKAKEKLYNLINDGASDFTICTNNELRHLPLDDKQLLKLLEEPPNHEKT